MRFQRINRHLGVVVIGYAVCLHGKPDVAVRAQIDVDVVVQVDVLAVETPDIVSVCSQLFLSLDSHLKHTVRRKALRTDDLA